MKHWKRMAISLLLASVSGVSAQDKFSSDIYQIEKPRAFTAFKRKIAAAFTGKCRACQALGLCSAIHKTIVFPKERIFEYTDAKGRQHDHGALIRVRGIYCDAGHFWTQETLYGSCWCGWKADGRTAKYLPLEIQEEHAELLLSQALQAKLSD